MTTRSTTLALVIPTLYTLFRFRAACRLGPRSPKDPVNRSGTRREGLARQEHLLRQLRGRNRADEVHRRVGVGRHVLRRDDGREHRLFRLRVAVVLLALALKRP